MVLRTLCMRTRLVTLLVALCTAGLLAAQTTAPLPPNVKRNPDGSFATTATQTTRRVETTTRQGAPKKAEEQVQMRRKSNTMVHALYFRHDRAEVDPTYMGNAKRLSDFRHKIDSIGINHIDSVRVVVQSSPEGKASYNENLSRRRAISTSQYFAQHYPDIMPLTDITPDGESWGQLKRFITNDRKIDDATRLRALHIIETTADLDLREQKLREMPTFFDYIFRTYYPRLRNTVVTTIYSTELVPQEPVNPVVGGGVVVIDTIWHTTVITDTIVLAGGTPPICGCGYGCSPETCDQCCCTEADGCEGGFCTCVHAEKTRASNVHRHPLVALKTNLLFDAVTFLNGEVEVPFKDRWSVMAETVWPWWLQRSHNRWCWELGSLALEGRYWFRPWETHSTWARWKATGRAPLTGLFVGVHAGAGYYDFQWKRHNGRQGEFATASGTFGYSRLIRRQLRMEFSIGLGACYTQFRKYHIDDNTEVMPDRDQHLWRDTPRGSDIPRWWFGPTQAKVSLVWLLDRKCAPRCAKYFKQKGGEHAQH